jgi:hypothetical protein
MDAALTIALAQTTLLPLEAHGLQPVGLKLLVLNGRPARRAPARPRA